MKKWILFYGCLMGIFAAPMPANAQMLRKPIPDKLVVLTFDDAPISQYTFVAPLLKKYGFDATFYVCEFPPNYTDTTLYMTWPQIQQLSKWGFEIGNHTQHHKHVNKLSKEALVAELSYIEQKCDSLHIPKLTSFAYPGYDTYKPAVETLVKMGYATARTGGNTFYDPLADNPYYIPSFTLGVAGKEKDLEFIQQAKGGHIAVLTFHGVPDLEHSWVSTTPALFETYLKYLKNNHFKVIAMKGLQEYIRLEEAAKLPLPLSAK